MKFRTALLLAAALMALTTGADALSFKATFGSIKLNARPGEVVTSKFSLTLDPAEQRTRFHALVEDWWPSEDGKQSFYAAAGTLEHSCGPWVVLNPVDADISGGDTLTVRLTIHVSPQARPGGYWCALTLNEVPAPGSRASASGVKLKASVSTGVFIFIAPVERQVSILGIAHDENGALVQVQNTGNAPITVRGQVEYRRSGADTPVLSVPISSGALLTERTVTGTYRAALPAKAALAPGTYSVRAVLDIGADAFVAAETELTVSAPVRVQERRSRVAPR